MDDSFALSVSTAGQWTVTWTESGQRELYRYASSADDDDDDDPGSDEPSRQVIRRLDSPNESVQDLIRLPSKGDLSSAADSVGAPPALSSLATGDEASTESCSSSAGSSLHWSAPSNDSENELSSSVLSERSDREHNFGQEEQARFGVSPRPLASQYSLCDPTLPQGQVDLAHMLFNVDYVSAMDIASESYDLSSMDEPISKDMARAVFTRLVVPTEISVNVQNPADVSTLYGGKRVLDNDDDDDDDPEKDGDCLSLVSLEDEDIEQGLRAVRTKNKIRPETRVAVSASAATSGATRRQTLRERYFRNLSVAEFSFLALIVGSVVTLAAILAVFLSG